MSCHALSARCSARCLSTHSRPAACRAAADARLIAEVHQGAGVHDRAAAHRGAELRFDEWDLDYAFAGTQKCLALPPGLGVYAVSDRALAVADGIDERGFLLDLPKSVKDTNAGKTLATPCVPLVYALQRQLDRIQTEGLEQRWHRHLELQAKTLAWAETKGFTPFVGDSAARSPTVSCIDAGGQDVEAMAKQAADSGFKMDKGYGDLKGKAFRIGHMGDHTMARLEVLLDALK